MEESMLVGFRKKVGTRLGAGSHRKEFSDPSFLKIPEEKESTLVRNLDSTV